MTTPDQPEVSSVSGDRPWIATEDVMAEVRARVRSEVRTRLARAGVRDFDDPAIFLAAEQLLNRALQQQDRQLLLLPELLDDEDDWRVNPSLNLSSHRPIAGGVIVWLKRALLLPLTRWLFDYSRENFARQERLNFVLMACVQQLAIENARLVARLDALDGGQQGQATPGNGSNPA